MEKVAENRKKKQFFWSLSSYAGSFEATFAPISTLSKWNDRMDVKEDVKQ
jgi:hypothetical protein